MGWFRHLLRKGDAGVRADAPPTWSRRPFVLARHRSSDGRRALEIVRLPESLYRYVEWIEQPGDEDVFPFLAPMHWSETYPSADDAVLAARRDIGWLSQQESRWVEEAHGELLPSFNQ